MGVEKSNMDPFFRELSKSELEIGIEACYQNLGFTRSFRTDVWGLENGSSF